MASAEGQQHPLSIYFWIWGRLFVFSAFSYASDFLPDGYFRWGFILLFMGIYEHRKKARTEQTAEVSS